MPGPRRILAPIKSFATRVCEGQGSDDPFSPGRCRPAGTLRLPLVLLWPWPGVIGAHAAHTRPTRWRRLTALAGRHQVPGCGRGDRCGPGERAGRLAGMAVQATGLDNRGTGPVRAVRRAAGGLRAAGGDAAVMAEQATSELAGLLRQLRAEAQLTQAELAKAAGLSPRAVSDLER